MAEISTMYTRAEFHLLTTDYYFLHIILLSSLKYMPMVSCSTRQRDNETTRQRDNETTG